MAKMENQLSSDCGSWSKSGDCRSEEKPRDRGGDEMGAGIRPQRELFWSRTADNTHVASSACSTSLNDLRRERAKTKPRAFPALSFSRKRLQSGPGPCSQVCLQRPSPAGPGLLPALLPGPCLARAVQGHPRSQPGLGEELRAAAGRRREVSCSPWTGGAPSQRWQAQQEQVRRNPSRSARWWDRLCAATEPSCVVCWVADQPEEQPVPFTRPSKVKKWVSKVYFFPRLWVFSLWVFLEGKSGRSEMVPCL